MKLLMIYMDRFAYKPTIKTLVEMETIEKGREFKDAQVAFIHAEEQDIENESNVLKKTLKNLKWIAGKNNTKRIILHSFAHLSESKAEPGFTKTFFDKVQKRLEDTGYEVYQTPFGYFLDLSVDAPGVSLARVFKSL
jgi:hypothetical protein